MSDYVAVPPQLTHTPRETEGLYQRFLSWMSMSKPGLWRLRIDIMVLNYLVLGIAALLAPVFLQPFAGVDPDAYCGGDRGSCAGNISFYENGGSIYYEWANGFSVNDIMWTTIAFVVASFVLTIIWAFFVSRGTRLRGLVVQSSFPGFLVVLAVLMPMVIFPLLAGMTMFITTHGGGLGTWLTGVTDVLIDGRTFEISFPGNEHYRGSSEQMFSTTLTALFMFGAFFAFVVAISMKIILADGVMGLVKSIVIAGILAAITVTIGLFFFDGDLYEHAFIQLVLLSTFGLIYYFWFRMSLIRNRRSKLSRTIGLSFCMYWIGFFPLVAILSLQWIDQWADIDIESLGPWTIVWIIALIYALFLSLTFRDISRINLLPEP